MSIGALAISEAPFSAQGGKTASTKNAPPKNRTVVANSDVIAQPEPR